MHTTVNMESDTEREVSPIYRERWGKRTCIIAIRQLASDLKKK